MKLTYTPDLVTAALAADEDLTLADGTVCWTEVFYGRSTQDTPIGVIMIVHTEGGYEGGGEQSHLVLKAEATGQYFRIDGYYSSYEGLEFDGTLREVQVTEKMVLVYE